MIINFYLFIYLFFYFFFYFFIFFFFFGFIYYQGIKIKIQNFIKKYNI